MIVNKPKKRNEKIEIDLTGPDGHFFSYIRFGLKRLCREFGIPFKPLLIK